jgi:hypothetical protein
MTESLHVENAEAVTCIFGRWPSFHDAEVLSMHFDRTGEDGPSLEVRVHVFNMTSEVDERGYFVLTNHTLVTFRFANIILRELRWFNAQNSLSGIGIEEVDPSASDGRTLGVSFDANYGVEADLLCDRITVRSVEPFAQAV